MPALDNIDEVSSNPAMAGALTDPSIMSVIMAANGGGALGGMNGTSELSNKFMKTSEGIMPERSEVLQKRQLLDDAMKRLSSAQAYRDPGFNVDEASYATGLMAPGYSSPYAKGFENMVNAHMKELERHQGADVASAETDTKAAGAQTEFNQKDIENAKGFAQLAEQSQLRSMMFNSPQQVYDKSANNGQGGFRFATKGEMMSNPNLQPASSVPDTEKSVPSPFGMNINKQTQEADKQKLSDVQKGTDSISMPEIGNSYETVTNILKKYPNLNSATPESPMANALMPESWGGMSAQDAKTLQAEVGKLKAAAMMGAKNVRNQLEFSAITAPGNLLGGTQQSALAQANALFAKPQLDRQYANFLNQYQAKWKTLTGADEVWNEFIQNNPPLIRDKNKVVTGINPNTLNPSVWSPYLASAPDIFKNARGGEGIDQGTSPPQAPQGGTQSVVPPVQSQPTQPIQQPTQTQPSEGKLNQLPPGSVPIGIDKKTNKKVYQAPDGKKYLED